MLCRRYLYFLSRSIVGSIPMSFIFVVIFVFHLIFVSLCIALPEFSSSRFLNIEACYGSITDIGVKALSGLEYLEELNISYLSKVAFCF